MAGDVDSPAASGVETIFHAALARSVPERGGYLAQACGENHQLRLRVEALLQAHQAPESFLPEQANAPLSGVPGLPGVSAALLTEQPGDTIGRYKLLEKIGEGGCGVVYMAEQLEPVRRRVALKIIKLGMDTRQVVARFEAERQALALMDHPNIAKVHDAGATETGRPYFVMELVGGIKITDYCDQNKLTTRQRLDLFIQVCRAVQHAHQKGIIHRDLKPSNVLVTTQDGVPVPKVIDFGIAKATQGKLTDQTLFTAFEQFLGTPAYMSPEQTQLGALDVDTRSDIYSLGVLLYELLTGKTPFDSKHLLAAGLDAMRRTIQEKEPPTPSTRLKQEHEATKAERRKQKAEIDCGELVKRLRGDLDWIAMKCLEKDRARRYETANGLAMDLQRHLNNEPVVAGPPSNLYRFQKAVRRNKTLFTAALVIAVVLVTGAAVSTWQAIRATSAKREALAEKHRANEEVAKQEAINSFLNHVLSSADPERLSLSDQAKGPTISMMQVLDAAARELTSGSLQDKPAIEAAVSQTLGRSYLNLGQTAAAEPLLQRALALNRSIYGESSDSAIVSLCDLTRLYEHEGKLGQAEELARKAIAMEQKLHGMEHPDVARALILLAGILHGHASGRHDPGTIAAAEATYREALAMQRKVLPSTSAELIEPLTGLADLVSTFGGSHIEARALLQEALRIQTTVYGQRHPATATVLNALASVLGKMQEFSEAERLSKEALKITQELFGTNSLALRDSFGRLAIILQDEHKFPEAEWAIRAELALHRRAVPGGLDVAWWLNYLAENLSEQQRFPEAEEASREGVRIWENFRGGGVGHADYWLQLECLVRILKAEGQLDEVEALYRNVLNRQHKELGDRHVAVPATLCALGDFLASRGKLEDAAELHRRALAMIPMLGPGRNSAATQSLVASLRAQGKAEELNRLYERLVAAENRSSENPNFFLGELLNDFGNFLGGQHRFDEAVQQHLKALPILRRRPDIILVWNLRSLGDAFLRCSRAAEAESCFRESIKLQRSFYQTDDLYGTAWPSLRLADALYQEGRLPEAVQTYRQALEAYRNCHSIGDEGYGAAVRALVDSMESEGKRAEAQSFLEDVLVQERQALPGDDVQIAATLLALAHCLQLRSEPEQAVRCSSQAVAMIANCGAEDLLRLPPTVFTEMMTLGLEKQAKEMCERVLGLSPTTLPKPYWINNSAWSLVLTENPSNRLSALAVRLARKDSEIPPLKTGLALGAALYRAEEYQKAVLELEQAAGRDQGNYLCWDLFFLAMAHYRLGHAEAAQRYYSQALNWTANNSPCHKSVVALRAEAEALLSSDRFRR